MHRVSCSWMPSCNRMSCLAAGAGCEKVCCANLLYQSWFRVCASSPCRVSMQTNLQLTTTAFGAFSAQTFTRYHPCMYAYCPRIMHASFVQPAVSTQSIVGINTSKHDIGKEQRNERRKRKSNEALTQRNNPEEFFLSRPSQNKNRSEFPCVGLVIDKSRQGAKPRGRLQAHTVTYRGNKSKSQQNNKYGRKHAKRNKRNQNKRINSKTNRECSDTNTV